jgi:transcriptional regulator with XRE-family HTH domain
MRTAVSDPAATRRAELAVFLRARRAELHPEDLGLYAIGGRRNTPGLRREEVAQLSGVSVTWYTWLEQGRPVDPSSQVVDALARALRLDAESHRHLRRLAGLAIPEPDQMPDDVRPELTRLLATLEPSPACLLGPRLDFVAWNYPFDRLWQPTSLPADRQNLMWLYFAKGTTARMTDGREERSRHLLGQFRAAAAQHVGDERFADLIDALHQESEQFRTWWPHYSVEQAITGKIRVF